MPKITPFASAMVVIALGAALIFMSFMYVREVNKQEPKSTLIKLTNHSSNATIEAVLGPRLAGDRPREFVWTDGKGNVVGEQFLLTDRKGNLLPKATQKRILNAMKKQGMIRLEQHCHGLSQAPPPAATFGYCTFEKIPLGLEG